jgi:hypothetical protein
MMGNGRQLGGAEKVSGKWAARPGGGPDYSFTTTTARADKRASNKESGWMAGEQVGWLLGYGMVWCRGWAEASHVWTKAGGWMGGAV